MTAVNVSRQIVVFNCDILQKCTPLTICIQFHGIKYFYIAVHHCYSSCQEFFSSCKTTALCPLNDSVFSIPFHTWQLPFSCSCSCGFDWSFQVPHLSRFSTSLFVTGLFLSYNASKFYLLLACVRIFFVRLTSIPLINSLILLCNGNTFYEIHPHTSFIIHEH